MVRVNFIRNTATHVYMFRRALVVHIDPDISLSPSVYHEYIYNRERDKERCIATLENWVSSGSPLKHFFEV